MTTTITLDEPHYRVAAEKARALGTTPEQYLQGLIDADSRTFDEILAPVRQGFASINESEAEELFDRLCGSGGRGRRELPGHTR